MNAEHEVDGWEQARTVALLLCAVTWFLVGLGIVFSVAGESPYVPHTSFPLLVRLATWWLPALLAAFTWFARSMAGWTVALLFVGPAVRVGSYLWGWGAYLLGFDGHPNGWYVAVLHVPFILVVVLAAILTRADRSGR